MISTGIPDFHLKILILEKMGKLDSSDTGNHILHGPLFPQNVKEFDAGRADVSTVRNGVGGFSPIQNNVKFGRDKIGMIG